MRFIKTIKKSYLALVFLFLAGVGVANEGYPKEMFSCAAGETLYCVAYDKDKGRVFCGSEDKHLYCFDSSSGELLWKKKTGNRVYGVACDRVSGRVFCGSGDKHLYCFDSSSGEFLWKKKTGSFVYGVACDRISERVFCGSADRHLYCFDSSSGDLLWKKKTGNWVFGVACDRISERVFCGSWDRHLYCFDSSSGELLWKKNVGCNAWFSQFGFDLEEKIIFVPCGLTLKRFKYGHSIQPYPTSDLSPLINSVGSFQRFVFTYFTFEPLNALNRIRSLFCTKNKAIYFVSEDGTLSCYGQEKSWTYEGVSTVYPPQFSPDGRSCFLSSEGDIVYLSKDGDEIALFSEQGQKLSPPVIDAQGNVYFCSKFGANYTIDNKGNVILQNPLFLPFSGIEARPFINRKNDLFWIFLKDKQNLVYSDESNCHFFGNFDLNQKGDIPFKTVQITSDNKMIFLDESNSLVCVDERGDLLWKKTFSFNITSNVVIGSEGNIYFGGDDKNIHCLSASGEEIGYASVYKNIVSISEDSSASRLCFFTEGRTLFYAIPLSLFPNTDLIPLYHWANSI